MLFKDTGRVADINTKLLWMAGVDVFMSFDVFAEFFFPRSNHATCAHMAYTISETNQPKTWTLYLIRFYSKSYSSKQKKKTLWEVNTVGIGTMAQYARI